MQMWSFKYVRTGDITIIILSVDFTEKKNGKWTIIETGNGSVSGLSEGQNYEAFYRAIKLIFEKEKELERD